MEFLPPALLLSSHVCLGKKRRQGVFKPSHSTPPDRIGKGCIKGQNIKFVVRRNKPSPVAGLIQLHLWYSPVKSITRDAWQLVNGVNLYKGAKRSRVRWQLEVKKEVEKISSQARKKGFDTILVEMKPIFPYLPCRSTRHESMDF